MKKVPRRKIMVVTYKIIYKGIEVWLKAKKLVKQIDNNQREKATDSGIERQSII